MGKKFLNENAVFKCPFLGGTITILNLQKQTINSVPMLTHKTQLIYAGTCNAKPTLAGPVPCTKGMCSTWVKGVDFGKTINGGMLLTADAAQMCETSGAFITAMPPTRPAAECGIGLGGVSSPPQTSAAENKAKTSGSHDGATAGESSGKPDNAATTAIGGAAVYAESSESSAKNQADAPEGENNTSAEKQTSEVPYAVCGYKHCEKTDVCEYLKAPHTLALSTLAPEPSAQLRANTPEKYKCYNEKCNPLMAESGEIWGNAAHHIISVKQIFAKFPELVKLANFYGYDINCTENGIYLPTYKDKSELDARSYKTAKAYEVMAMTGMQWHSGGHAYNISAEDFANIKDDKKAMLRDYETAVKDDIRKYVVACYFRNSGCCRYDDKNSLSKKIKAEKFKKRMNFVSEKVYEKLMMYSNPKSSFPYFVSKVALQYAYNVPKSGKIITVENSGGNIVFTKYRYSKNLKDDNDIIFTEKGKYIYNGDDMGLVVFCENVKYFLTINSDEYTIPFSQCDFTEVYMVKTDKDSLIIEKNSLILYKKDNVCYNINGIFDKLKFFVSEELEKNTDTYKTPQAVIAMRKKYLSSEVKL